MSSKSERSLHMVITATAFWLAKRAYQSYQHLNSRFEAPKKHPTRCVAGLH